MRIIRNSLAVFWRSARTSGRQFHADMYPQQGESTKSVVRRFKDMFPDDVVCSVRNEKGRFVKFKD